jgi:hypothetical protein
MPENRSFGAHPGTEFRLMDMHVHIEDAFRQKIRKPLLRAQVAFGQDKIVLNHKNPSRISLPTGQIVICFSATQLKHTLANENCQAYFITIFYKYL